MLDDVASASLQAALAGLNQRQQVTANNIANIETPGFSASSVSFESNLAAAIADGDPSAAAPTVAPTGAPAGLNGNNVNLDTEMVTATKTTLQEQLITAGLTAKFGLISTVAKA